MPTSWHNPVPRQNSISHRDDIRKDPQRCLSNAWGRTARRIYQIIVDIKEPNREIMMTHKSRASGPNSLPRMHHHVRRSHDASVRSKTAMERTEVEMFDDKGTTRDLTEPRGSVSILMNRNGHPQTPKFDDSTRRVIQEQNLFIARRAGYTTTREFLTTRVAEILVSTKITRILAAVDAIEKYLPHHIIDLRCVETFHTPMNSKSHVLRNQRMLLRLAEGAAAHDMSSANEGRCHSAFVTKPHDHIAITNAKIPTNEKA